MALYVIDFKGNNPRFVAYFLKHTVRQYKSDNAAVPGVDRNVLHRLRVSLPDRNIQEHITNILSTYDDLIENNRRRIALLERAAYEIYREWSVRLRFPGYGHTKIVDGVQEGWERTAFRNICQLKYGRALKAEHRVQGKYPAYRSSGIIGTHDKARVQGPGVIIGRKGNVGSVYWSEGILARLIPCTS